MKNTAKVCVTGGSGYIGSSLVKKLLERGYVVQIWDQAKVRSLKSLPNADTNLVLFQADIYNVNDFEAAIEGCDFVLHVANPSRNGPPNSQYKSRIEATVGTAKGIAEACIRSKTVKRLIYTGSILAASPLNGDGNTSKSCLDESCWTPSCLSFSRAHDSIMDYVRPKTMAEQELLRYNEVGGGKLEVVTLTCGVVGGDSILSYVPSSVEMANSQITRNSFWYNHVLIFMQQVLGSIPIVHIEDVCEAHIFCIENPKIKGRFLCCAANPMSMEIANYFTQHYPEFTIIDEFMEEGGEKIKMDASKSVNIGFACKYHMNKILDDNIKCGRRLGALSQLAT